MKRNLKTALAVLTAAAVVSAAVPVCAKSVSLNNTNVEAPLASAAEEITDTSDGTAVTAYEELAAAITAGDKIIYVMNDIEMGDMIELQGGQQLIGVPDSETGKLPVLNFENMKGVTDIINNTSNDSDVGIRIKTADNTVKNLVVEKAHDNGIQIKGEGATGNTLENVISRYNNDSGVQIAGGAANTTLIGVYSYRNCDVYTLGSNADGFAIKLGAGPAETEDEDVIDAGKITLINCAAWDNGDDGWDSYDKEDQTYWTYRLDYTNCIGWNNGDSVDAMGYADYHNGLQLDENLPVIARFKAVNQSGYNKFATLYNKGALCSRNASLEEYCQRLDSLLGTMPTRYGDLNASGLVENWDGNPNGFKLGSKISKENNERRMYNCISFDHNKKGFDNNNSFSKIWAVNCISFDNNQNYKLSHEGKTYTAYEWKNVYSWNGNLADDLPVSSDGSAITVSDEKESLELEIRAAAAELQANAENDIIIYTDIFETVFETDAVAE
ncbi:MAG: hypothetical protein LUG66_08145 [Clostridiales bacterium]|nr:hypothetical protein [Clostridiales bacterium]